MIKKRMLILLFVFSFKMIYSQTDEIVDISKNIDYNYTFATIFWDNVIKKELSSTSVVILIQGDPKNTPEDYFDGTGEVLFNVIVSLSNTGEFAKSKLFSIPLVNSPEILNIEEDIKAGKINITLKQKDRDGKDFVKVFDFERIF